jgi:hypothetical protein
MRVTAIVSMRASHPRPHRHEQVAAFAFDFRQDAVLVVEHETGKPVALGQAINERPKPDALDGAAALDPIARLG